MGGEVSSGRVVGVDAAPARAGLLRPRRLGRGGMATQTPAMRREARRAALPRSNVRSARRPKASATQAPKPGARRRSTRAVAVAP